MNHLNIFRFVKFIADEDSMHVSYDETMEYEKYAMSNDLIDDENEI